MRQMSKQSWPILPMMQNSPPRSTRQTTPEATRAASQGQMNVLVAVMNSYIDNSDNVNHREPCPTPQRTLLGKLKAQPVQHTM